ncbi:helix-turn-helix domain-containing protein [Alkalinema pantanalense CENA528]|uniref:helix-turn-helix domain-containing protein n=1 Tax=Alkalinema pantanalense TaxID=1620705 RepID=UPI003D6EED6F
MGLVRLRIRELANAVAERAGVNYSTLKSYVQRGALNTVDLSAVYKIAQVFEVSIEDLMEILEDETGP